MKEENKYIPVAKLAIAMLLFYFSSLIILVPVLIFNIDLETCSNFTNNALRLFSNSFLALMLFLLFKNDIIKDFNSFKKNIREISDVVIKYWLLGFFLMIISNLIIGFFSPVSKATNEEAVRSIIYSTPVMAFFITCILAPFTEEIIFRKSIKDAISRKWFFILISGFVFGALHVIGEIESLYGLLYIIPYSSLGLAFATIYYETDNIFANILAHLIHNTLSFILIISVGGAIV
ncbi:MAG: CPBP family intramembrane metalloprotease [Bacilli bacterium]|nr:CPBP family intramembrane metalloprotease [Bacilli bacterium]